MVLRPSSRPLQAPLAETFTNSLLRLIPSLNHHWIISGTLGTTWLEVAWCCLSVHPHTYTSKVNWSQSFPIPFYLEESSDSLHQIVFSPRHQEFALTADSPDKMNLGARVAIPSETGAANAFFGPCTSSRFIGWHGPRFVDETHGYIACRFVDALMAGADEMMRWWLIMMQWYHEM